MYSKTVNDFIRENYDRLCIVVPKGTKDFLRGEFLEAFSGEMTLNRYINCLIELDLRGKVVWGDFDEDCRLLQAISRDA